MGVTWMAVQCALGCGAALGWMVPSRSDGILRFATQSLEMKMSAENVGFGLEDPGAHPPSPPHWRGHPSLLVTSSPWMVGLP